mmetsp:Transcript_76505/g.224558  ORF Transcript_76505/g.224558 Transcript_76505/m.224558 type:complete len:278 (+) Transcript_76505:138-971(+)
MSGIDASRFKEVDPTAKPGYADPRYWVARYQADSEPFDWYLRWDLLRDLLLPLLSADAEVLVLGSGTSLLSEQIYTEGFMNITNVDRCELAISAMRARHQAQREALAAAASGAKKPAKGASPEPAADPLEGKPAMCFESVEAKDLPQCWAARFDLIIDKALLDSVACGQEKMKATAAVLSCVSSVLKPKGVYVCISWAPPDMRWPMLAASDCDDRGRSKERPQASVEYGWEISHQTVPRPLTNPTADPKAKDKIELVPSPAFSAEENVYHIYTCTKL